MFMLLSIFNDVYVLGIKNVHAFRNCLVIYFGVYLTMLLKSVTVTTKSKKICE
jgi:hypothetical protein